MKTTVIGLGLIGGCIALDLKKAGMVRGVIGIESNPEHARKAVELGLAFLEIERDFLRRARIRRLRGSAVPGEGGDAERQSAHGHCG